MHRSVKEFAFWRLLVIALCGVTFERTCRASYVGEAFAQWVSRSRCRQLGSKQVATAAIVLCSYWSPGSMKSFKLCRQQERWYASERFHHPSAH